VSTEPSPRPRSMETAPRCVHGLPRTTCVFCSQSYWHVMLIWAGVLIVWWFARGPGHPVYAPMLTTWTWLLGPGVAGPVMRRLPRRWFRVPAGERVLHGLLGVGIFGWLLDRSGWNRHQAEPMRGFDGTRAGLPSLEQSVRGAACAHGTSFTIHALLATVAVFIGHPWGALWILLPGVVLHLYPVLLQRSIMLRLQPLLDKSGSDRPLPS
jgi:Glycosyl-4,4'-diaponeurosporenoate acyltransferase